MSIIHDINAFKMAYSHFISKLRFGYYDKLLKRLVVLIFILLFIGGIYILVS